MCLCFEPQMRLMTLKAFIFFPHVENSYPLAAYSVPFPRQFNNTINYVANYCNNCLFCFFLLLLFFLARETAGEGYPCTQRHE